MIHVFFLFFLGLASINANTVPVVLGDSTVLIQRTSQGPGKAFIHLHQNETTALKAALAVIHEEGGSVLTLIHTGGRNIVFHLKDQRYEFDPNRIFTDEGIKKTLSQLSKYSEPAHQEIKKLAQQIKQMLPKGKVIAVHNNRDYSLKNYFPGRDLAQDARAYYVNPDKKLRNFYLVTKKKEFLRLKDLNFNSILQAPKATDDGSLSVYLAKKDYVNVEAGFDQLVVQIHMLRHA